jgi:antitoxin ParD1/3/4
VEIKHTTAYAYLSNSYLFISIIICGKISVCQKESRTMSTITISIPDQLKAFIATQMKKRGFDNVSEYFRSLIRDAQEREAEAWLEALLLEGLGSKDMEVSEGFWKDLKADAKVLVKKHAQQRKKKAA